MFVSIVIPTYNRRPILYKCLKALENQILPSICNGYEIVVVDDGSQDGTQDWLRNASDEFPHVVLLEQEHGGAAKGRNFGVSKSRGDIIVFIDSDLVVKQDFLSFHIKSLCKAWHQIGSRLCFTYGSVVNTSNFDYPTSEKFKLRDISFAYFATGNIAIDKELLLKSGLFDTTFSLYGWEDLELGERLRRMGVVLIKCPKAIGYHWHPALTLDQIPDLIKIEKERAKMALIFYRKHPTLRVRFIIQFTLLHRLLWEVLSLGGILNERSLRPFIAFLLVKGYSGLAMELLRIPLNRIGVKAIYREAELLGLF